MIFVALGFIVLFVVGMVALVVHRKAKIAAGEPVFHLFKQGHPSHFWVLIPLLMFTACKQCNDPTGPAMRFSHFIGEKWECKNQVAVDRDVSRWFASKKLCTMPPQTERGAIANMVCPLLGAALRIYAVSKVPTEWECNPGKIGVHAADALVSLCELAPF